MNILILTFACRFEFVKIENLSFFSETFEEKVLTIFKSRGSKVRGYSIYFHCLSIDCESWKKLHTWPEQILRSKSNK